MSALMRIGTIAINTVREAVRNKLLYALLLFAALLILSGVFLSSLSYVESERILQDIGMAAIRLLGVAIAIRPLDAVAFATPFGVYWLVRVARERRGFLNALPLLAFPVGAVAATLFVNKTLTGNATFEGADLMWIDEKTAMIGRGLRTNDTAITQIGNLFAELDIELIAVDMPFGTMHFMGMLRIADRDLAIAIAARIDVRPDRDEAASSARTSSSSPRRSTRAASPFATRPRT